MTKQLKELIELKNPLSLDLQHFSSEDDPEPEDDLEDKDPEPEDDTKDKTFTQSEVDSQISKAVEKALNNRDKEVEKRIEEERKEAERLAKLTEKEREKEELTQREKELEKRAAELERKELLSDAESTLRDKNLPTSFSEVLLGDDAEKTLENINKFKESFDTAVSEAVKEKLRQDTPPSGEGKPSNKAPSMAELARENRIIK